MTLSGLLGSDAGAKTWPNVAEGLNSQFRLDLKAPFDRQRAANRLYIRFYEKAFLLRVPPEPPVRYAESHALKLKYFLNFVAK